MDCYASPARWDRPVICDRQYVLLLTLHHYTSQPLICFVAAVSTSASFIDRRLSTADSLQAFGIKIKFVSEYRNVIWHVCLGKSFAGAAKYPVALHITLLRFRGTFVSLGITASAFCWFRKACILCFHLCTYVRCILKSYFEF